MPQRIECEKAKCTRDAARILHWDGYSKPVWMLCNDCAEAALKVVHI